MTSLPLFKGAALVVETEVATRKPPLDGTAQRGASTPAIGVAGALAAAGVVDPLEQCPRDPPSLALLAVFEPEACAEPNQYEPADSIERALDARSNEDVPSACHGDRVADEPANAHRVEQRPEQKQVTGRAVRADELRQETGKEDRDLGVENVAYESLSEGQPPTRSERAIG